MDLPAEESTVAVDGQRIHYLEAGEGPPLVLLHGGIIDAAHISWGELIEPLATQARVIAPDLPGYGRSSVPDGAFGVPDHVDTVVAFFEELNLTPTVAGISMGGGVAIGLGLQIPDRVQGIVALAPFALGGGLPNGTLSWLLAKVQVMNYLSLALMRRSRGFLERSVNALCHDTKVSEMTLDRIAAELDRPGAGAGFRNLRAGEVTRTGYRTNYTPQLQDLEVPVRFVHGREDEVIPVEVSERAHDRAPDGDLFVLEDTGHLVTLEAPDRVRDLVTGALQDEVDRSQ